MCYVSGSCFECIRKKNYTLSFHFKAWNLYTQKIVQPSEQFSTLVLQLELVLWQFMAILSVIFGSYKLFLAFIPLSYSPTGGIHVFIYNNYLCKTTVFKLIFVKGY